MMGLSRICLMMEDSLLSCANTNWGFAHPLLNFILTKITGNLLISQRILSALFTMGAFFLCERIMRTLFQLKNRMIMTVTLVAMALSPWTSESILSVHLDIASVFFVLAGLLMMNSPDRGRLVLAGFLITISAWFRFHYLIFILLFPLLVYAIHARHRGFQKAGYTLIGIIPGLLIPYILNYAAYGHWFISNHKMILALSGGILKLTNNFAPQLENMSYSQMASLISWPLYLSQRWEMLIETRVMLPLIVMGISYAVILLWNGRAMTGEAEKKTDSLSILNTVEYNGFLIFMYLMLSVFPFVLIRGLTFRLESAFFIPFIPIMALMLESRMTRRYYIVILIYLMVNWGQMTMESIEKKHDHSRVQERIAREVERVIPPEIRKLYSHEILNGMEVYNRENPYLLFSPVVTGGWMVHSRPLADHFGRVDLETLHHNYNYKRYRYIILAKRPSFSFWQYDTELLSKGTMVAETKNMYILQPHR